MIKINLGDTEINLKKNSMTYNYIRSPFSYKLRKGKNLKLKNILVLIKLLKKL